MAEEKEKEAPLADSWQLINGGGNWSGMLDPIHPLLRTELMRYGEMAQACYDAFDDDTFSKYFGTCKYQPADLFNHVDHTAETGYEVTRYLYATIHLNLFGTHKRCVTNSNWIGFVAVSSDQKSKLIGRRDILVVWRGTSTRLEWISNFTDLLSTASSEGIPCPDPRVKVHSGFLGLYTDKAHGRCQCHFCDYSARQRVVAEIRRLLTIYKDEDISITFTGHSLGGALALLSAYDIAESGLNKTSSGTKIPICVFSFSAPSVGNRRFKERVEELGVKVLRVINNRDVVPKVPGVFVNEKMPKTIRKFADKLPWSYSHVGVVLALDHKKSPFLKSTKNPVCFHSLEVLMHLLDGYQGKDRDFCLSTGRDVALINKASNFLKKEYRVPPYWRQERNKGLVKDDKGHWVQEERLLFDDYLPDIHHIRLEHSHLKPKIQVSAAKGNLFGNFYCLLLLLSSCYKTIHGKGVKGDSF